MLSEVEALVVTQLVETRTDRALVAQLDEAAALSDVCDVSKTEVAFVKRGICTVLQELVALVA